MIFGFLLGDIKKRGLLYVITTGILTENPLLVSIDLFLYVQMNLLNAQVYCLLNPWLLLNLYGSSALDIKS